MEDINVSRADMQAYLEAMAGSDDVLMPPSPLTTPMGVPLDEGRFYLVLRWPTGLEFDDLQALSVREYVEREVQIYNADPTRSRRVERRYQETKIGPLIKLAVDKGLIAKGQLPQRVGGAIQVYVWKGNAADDWKFLSASTPALLQAVARVIDTAIYTPAMQAVMQLGEESQKPQDTSTSQEVSPPEDGVSGS
jgi:hypothetical protein